MAKRKIQIENFTSPGKVYTVEADKFEALRDACLSVVTSMVPGLTPAQITTALLPHLPDDPFPGCDKASW